MLVFLSALAEIPANVVPALFLVDSSGRKRTLIGSFVLCAVACVAVAASAGASVYARLPMVMVARAGATSAFSTVYVYTPEVYPTRIRATGVGAASAVARLAGIVTTFVAVDVNLELGLCLYAAAALVAAACVSMFPRETANVRLEEHEQDREEDQAGTRAEAVEEAGSEKTH